MSEAIRDWLQARAFEFGFHAIGITHPDALPHFGGDLGEFLAAGYHGEMGWLERRADERASPSRLWPDCRSIIMLGECYPAPGEAAPRDCGEISAYARGDDYHDVVKKRLKRLAREMIAHEPCEVKVFVDTAPVMEKPLAAAAGIGWVGRHGNLLSRDLGNWFFLGSIFTDLEIPADAPASDHCGSCRACVDACPTDAFDADGRLDARRCISYLTIEYKGAIPPEFRGPMSNLIYGCDICLAACPWNKFAHLGVDTKLAHRAENIAPPLGELLRLDEEGFRKRFARSPIKRVGWRRMMRNALIAAGNSGDHALLPLARRFMGEDELLDDAARWAIRELEGV